MIRRLRSCEAVRSVPLFAVACACAILMAPLSLAQTPATDRPVYPESIRGYKVERAGPELSRPEMAAEGKSADALIQLGDPELAQVTPLGVTLEVPIWISPVKQGGRVDSLTFENMVVNGVDVDVDEYLGSFDLPKKKRLRLPRPLRIFVSTPGLVGGALDEWVESKERWQVTGRVYVFGHFRKYLIKFKRVVPIEIDLEIQNPLKQNDQSTK
jgi:hypothetical protein